MSNSVSDEKEVKEINRPTGAWFSIIFCFAYVILFSFIVVMTQLNLFPANDPQGYYFQKSGMALNLSTNALFAASLAVALFNLRSSAVYLSLGMFLFDFISTSYWFFTSNWLAEVGVVGMTVATIFWCGSLVIFLYCLSLRQRELLN